MTMMIRTSIAAAALMLAAATPSFADGFGRGPNYPQYDERDGRPAGDYSGRVVFDEHADHCAPRRQVVEEGYSVREGYVGQPAVRPAPNYGRYDRGYDHGGY
jgi:hypothetical protein